MKTALLFAVLGAILAFALWGAVVAFGSLDGAQMSGHGIFALILGIVFSLGLGGGLMALTFYSSRAGYDDQDTPR